MPGRNALLKTPPHDVEAALRALGRNLNVARRRRRLTLAQVAEKIGAGVRAVMDAERGKPSTSIAVYTALLWAYGLLGDFGALAAPERDAEGTALSLSREGSRVRPSRVDNDF